MELALEILKREISQRELAQKHNHLRKAEIELELESLNKVVELLESPGFDWTYVHQEDPPIDIEVLTKDPSGVLHLTTWRSAYNIFSCQYKTDSSRDWQWKIIK